MTREQKALLEPHAQHYAAMCSYVRECSDGELQELMDACLAATPTSCWFCTYHAAQYLKREVQSEMNERQRRMTDTALKTQQIA